MEKMHLPNLNDLKGGLEKLWIFKSRSDRHKVYNYLQKINFSIQDFNLEIDSLTEFFMKNVVYFIMLITWIQEAIQRIEGCYKTEVLAGFEFSKQSALNQADKYIKALRSFVIAHPLSTTRHGLFGFDGDMICVDIHHDGITFPFTSSDRFFHLSIDGLFDGRQASDDFYLFVYSAQKDEMLHYCYIGCSFNDLFSCAKMYIEKLYALDKYMCRQKKKDYAK